MSIDYTYMGGSSRPQQNRNEVIGASLSMLDNQELLKVNKIIDKHNDQKNKTILDKSFGEVINNTINFFGNSLDSYNEKLIEAEFTKNIYDTEYEYLNKLQKNLIAISLFIRDDDNIIYLGIIMMILSVLICFFNISREYGYSGTNELGKK